jgi:hypothetical protein
MMPVLQLQPIDRDSLLVRLARALPQALLAQMACCAELSLLWWVGE